jgi:aminopeptidase N
MEFSGMVFVSHDWFLRYEGKPDTWLTVITAHEIAHQWWYSLVGNDQGEAPYLDEALALYSELLYLEDKYPALVPWWWQFRVKMYQPQGYVDSRTFDFTNLRLYINAVYLRGALMLQEIRERIGDEAFYKWLRAYATAQSSRIAAPADLWQAMSSTDYGKTADIRLKYLRQPDPLNPPLNATGAATAAPTDPCCG